MTKEEAKQKLRKSGYNVVEDNSVVTVFISPETNMKNAIRDIKEKLYAWGYNASFGVKQHKGAEDMATEEAREEILEDEMIEEEAEVEVQAEAEAEAVVAAPAKDTLEAPAKVEATKAPAEESSDSTDDDDEWFDEEDSDMLLTEESIQFSLEDFGLDF